MTWGMIQNGAATDPWFQAWGSLILGRDELGQVEV